MYIGSVLYRFFQFCRDGRMARLSTAWADIFHKVMPTLDDFDFIINFILDSFAVLFQRSATVRACFKGMANIFCYFALWKCTQRRFHMSRLAPTFLPCMLSRIRYHFLLVERSPACGCSTVGAVIVQDSLKPCHLIGKCLDLSFRFQILPCLTVLQVRASVHSVLRSFHCPVESAKLTVISANVRFRAPSSKRCRPSHISCVVQPLAGNQFREKAILGD